MKLSTIPSLACLLLLCSSAVSFTPSASIQSQSSRTTQLFSTVEKEATTTSSTATNGELLKRDRYVATNRKLFLYLFALMEVNMAVRFVWYALTFEIKDASRNIMCSTFV